MKEVWKWLMGATLAARAARVVLTVVGGVATALGLVRADTDDALVNLLLAVLGLSG